MRQGVKWCKDRAVGRGARWSRGRGGSWNGQCRNQRWPPQLGLGQTKLLLVQPSLQALCVFFHSCWSPTVSRWVQRAAHWHLTVSTEGIYQGGLTTPGRGLWKLPARSCWRAGGADCTLQELWVSPLADEAGPSTAGAPWRSGPLSCWGELGGKGSPAACPSGVCFS